MRRHARTSHRLIMAGLLLAGCLFEMPHRAAAQEAPDPAAVAESAPNLKAAAEATGMLGRMMEVTRLAGLDDPEIEVGPLTLLAPSDAAFDALPPLIKERLLAPENRAHLTDLLLFHALPGLYPTERLLKARVRTYTVQAIDGSEVLVKKSRKTGIIDIEGARIVRPDVIASDGIIHVIDKVLIPPPVLEALLAPPSTEVAAEGDR